MQLQTLQAGHSLEYGLLGRLGYTCLNQLTARFGLSCFILSAAKSILDKVSSGFIPILEWLARLSVSICTANARIAFSFLISMDFELAQGFQPYPHGTAPVTKQKTYSNVLPHKRSMF